MVTNDVDAIGRFIADDWLIIGSDGNVRDRAWLLTLIGDGRLTHHTMTTEDADVRIYGDAAVLVATGVSAGHFDGQPFEEHERQSNVFVRRDGEWRCVLTHLSRLAGA